MIFDLLLVIVVGYVTYTMYKSDSYSEIFRYVILMVAFTISVKYALGTAIYLRNEHILKADTLATMILIGFGLNLILVLVGLKLLDIFAKIFLRKETRVSKEISGYALSFAESVLVVTFVVYLLSQIVVVQKLSDGVVKSSYTYKHIKHFYKTFLNDDFVEIITGSDTGTNRKEVILKSLQSGVDSL